MTIDKQLIKTHRTYLLRVLVACLESIVERLLLNHTKLKKGNGALRSLRAYIHSSTMLNNMAQSLCWAGVSLLGLDLNYVSIRSRISATRNNHNDTGTNIIFRDVVGTLKVDFCVRRNWTSLWLLCCLAGSSAMLKCLKGYLSLSNSLFIAIKNAFSLFWSLLFLLTHISLKFLVLL